MNEEVGSAVAKIGERLMITEVDENGTVSRWKATVLRRYAVDGESRIVISPRVPGGYSFALWETTYGPHAVSYSWTGSYVHVYTERLRSDRRHRMMGDEEFAELQRKISERADEYATGWGAN